ncbi:MAG: hypothetical protein CMH55_10805 [Myxococcales bacterium]|nr:hypothetical protein [Myxococcales bacterium]
MAVDGKNDSLTYTNPAMDLMARLPGVDIFTSTVDRLLTWGSSNSLWMFPMATSCCGIEFMASATARVDIDRMGTIVRGSPRQGDVMVVAGTITVKMAPRVKKLWDQMPEPKWCVAMGSCAISGDFYRDIYSVIPGIDTVVPVDIYVPGCPPNPEQLMAGLMRLQEKMRAQQRGEWTEPEIRPETEKMNTQPDIRRLLDDERDEGISQAQYDGSCSLGMHGNEHRRHDQVGNPVGVDREQGVEALILRAQAHAQAMEALRQEAAQEFAAAQAAKEAKAKAAAEAKAAAAAKAAAEAEAAAADDDASVAGDAADEAPAGDGETP